MNIFTRCFLLALLLTACANPNEKASNNRQIGVKVPSSNILISPIPPERLESAIPLISEYKAQKKEVLESQIPVIPLRREELKNEEYQLAQEIALSDPRFLRDAFSENGEALHTEITSIRQFKQEDLEKYKLLVPPNAIYPYMVELYNYFHNTVTNAIVDVGTQRVLKVEYFQSSTPVINQRLKQIAVELAINHPEVIQELQVGKEELKANFYPEIVDSKCERSRHLCTGLEFVVNGKKVTVIVDLTDMQVVGINTQKLSDSKRSSVITERTLQNEYVMDAFCSNDNSLEKEGWEISYALTSSDGLEIKNCSFNGEKIIESAKLVDWHVSYTFKDGFGYSDAMGCPMFSAAAVVAFKGPEVEDIIHNGAVVGFSLVQDFRSPVWPMACNYRYQNRYEFYKDGRFRIAGVSLGLGCGTGGWYRPVFRIALNNSNTFGVWKGGSWENWTAEAWHLQDEKTSYSPEGYLFKMTNDQGKGYYIEPAQGQFGVGDRGDNAYSYVGVQHPQEGEEDIPTFGPCCNETFEQGPEVYLAEPEPFDNQNLVFWYVPQMENDDTEGSEFCWATTRIKDGQAHKIAWPGIVGPMFVPVK